MSIHLSFYLYLYLSLYIYIYIYGGGLWVLWVIGGIISGIFETALKCLEDLPLSIFVRRPHRELAPRAPAKLEEKTKDIVRSQKWDSGAESQTYKAEDVAPDIQAQDVGLVSRL